MEDARRQNIPFAAILCYDDGSTDDTVSVAQSLGLDIVKGNPNRGVAHVRNQLAARAVTEWIHFHDVDDRMAPKFLERMAPLCDDAHDVVSCDSDWINDSDGTLQIAWRYDPVGLGRAPLPHLIENPMSLNNSIIRRCTWGSVGGCDESLAIWEDADVHIRLARVGARWWHVPEVLTQAVRRSESFSHDYRRNWLCRLATLEGYAADPFFTAFQKLLAAEAEKTAAALAVLRLDADARRAVSLCRRLGRNPPTTQQPLLRLLKPFVPGHTLLRWQSMARQRATSQQRNMS